ncbi:MAG TPA: methyltransferase [Spirochaetota bacterium]|nr:methyltransferase [Spirochaetota bacterium]
MRIRELQKAVEETIFVGQSHRLGIFEQLHLKPDTAEGFAERMGFDLRCTRVLLEALVEMKYLVKSDSKYSITEESHARLVDKEGIEYEGSFWNFLMYLINPWRSLPYVLEHGKPDQSSYEGFSMIDFIEGMDSPWKKKLAPEIVELCLRHCPEAKSAADIGGAPGTMAKEFARRGLHTIVYDLPESLEVTKDRLSTLKNIVVVEGDATKELPEGPYDIAFLGNICHGQSPEDNAAIMRMCYEKLSDGGVVIVFDNLRGESYLGATVALHMITQSPGGDIYSRNEYTAWLLDAGFENITVEQLSDPAWQIMVGYK